MRAIIANRDERPAPSHDIAAQTGDREQLPEPVQHLQARREKAAQARRGACRSLHDQRVEQALDQQRFIDEHLSRGRGQDQGLDYGLEL